MSSSVRDLPAFENDVGTLLSSLTRAIVATPGKFYEFSEAQKAKFDDAGQLRPAAGASFVVAIGRDTSYVMLVVSLARDVKTKEPLCFDAALYADGRINSDDLFRFVPNAHSQCGWALYNAGLGGAAWQIKPLPGD